MSKSCMIATLLLLISPPSFSAEKQSREQKVRADKKRVEAEGFWIYNDIERAYREARQTGKPICVSLRCLPCEECVKLDDELVDTDPVIRPLLEKFVCVRIVGTNGLDLNVFQYDTDQSFAVFLLNADKTVYGRFGTRSHRTDWLGDVSLQGMARALEGALALHQRYPANKDQLAGKLGQPLEFASPEQYPSLKDKYTDRLNYDGDVVKSCIHCHQIGDARREYYWSRGKSIPERIMFPYPHPKAVGLVLDPEQRAKVKDIAAGSAAEAAGLRVDDEILALDGQPLISMADIQWVLHHTSPEGAELDMLVRRDGSVASKTLKLQSGWRRKDKISWRVSSWGMRRIATGGMKLVALDDQERVETGLTQGMSLKAEHVGRYGAHAAAWRAGFRPGDILVSFDGREDLTTEAALFAYVNDHHKAGDRVSVEYVRGGKRQTKQLPIQK